MHKPPESVVCTVCGAAFVGVPVRDRFAGFGKITCPTCNASVSVALTKGNQTQFMVLLVATVIAAVIFKTGIPLILAAVFAWALIKNNNIRKQASVARPPTTSV